MIDKEKETSPWKDLSTLFRKIKHFFEVLVKHIKRFFEVMFKEVEEYKMFDEKLRDYKYITRINIVIITIAVIVTIFNLSGIVWLILGYL